MKNDCPYCKLIKESKDRRLYYETDDFILIEDLFLMTPILVYKEHGKKDVSPQVFEVFKKIVSQLHGWDFSLLIADESESHFYIKASLLNQKTHSFPEPPPIDSFDVEF